MGISEKMQDALNGHVAYEIYSAHIYLAMSAYFESIDLPGAARWMRVQYQEELFHAQKIFDHVIGREGRAVVQAIDAPPAEWGSALEAFQAAYRHEQDVSARVGKLVELARSEKDHAAEIFLQWFVNEQVEEEATVKAIVQQFKLVGESKDGIFLIDRELATRTFTPPAAGP